MTEQYGTRSAQRVAAHVIGMLFDGRLRGGDRVDRDAVAAELGVSRVPVQEALVQLERDGIIATKFKRGAYVTAFDAETVREHYALFGLLNGYAAETAARRRTPELADILTAAVERMRVAVDPETFDAAAWQFRRAVNQVAAGPRLRALLTSFAGFIPAAYRQVLPDEQAAVLGCYEAELAGIRDRRPAAARRAALARARLLAEATVSELRRRGVLRDEEADSPPPDRFAGEPADQLVSVPLDEEIG